MSLFPNFDRHKKSQAAQRNAAGSVRQSQSGYSSPMRYGSSRLWQSILKKMGPWGSLVSSLFGSDGEKADPQVAQQLEAALVEAQKLLERAGYEVKQKNEPAKQRDDGSREPDVGGTEATEDELPEGVEQTKSGELIEWVMVKRSSNVYAFAFAWKPESKTGDMLVRFLGGDGKHRSGPGAMYRYFDVPREVFIAFKMAPSVGGAVWDNLRIRGTIAGHQFAYALESIGNLQTIPRQAVVGKRGRGGPAFVKRTFQGRQSALPERQIRGRALTKDFRGEASRIRLRRN